MAQLFENVESTTGVEENNPQNVETRFSSPQTGSPAHHTEPLDNYVQLVEKPITDHE
jgi:hypothetical protein